MSYSSEQRKVIRDILRAAKAEGANRTEQLAAFDTGIVEAGLTNPHGGDGSSIGWRQETASSYPNVDRMNVYEAARRFFRETDPLKNKLTPGALSQAVQRSAFPGRYAQHTKEAAKILAQFGGGGAAQLAQQASGGTDPKQLAAQMNAAINSGVKQQDPYEQYLETVKALNQAAQTGSTKSTDPTDPYGVMKQQTDLSSLVESNNKLMALAQQVSSSKQPSTKTQPATADTQVAGTGVQKSIKWAESHLGFNEHGTNNVPWLGVHGAAWCGYFATTAARKGGAAIPVMGYVPDIAAAAAAKRNGFSGWSNGTSGARAGDLAIIHTAAGAHGHVAYVVGVNKDGSINTIEGNWSDGVVRLKRRSEVTGIAHVNYR